MAGGQGTPHNPRKRDHGSLVKSYGCSFLFFLALWLWTLLKMNKPIAMASTVFGIQMPSVFM